MKGVNHGKGLKRKRDVKPLIGNMLLSDVKTSHCQHIMNKMAVEGYRTSTLYQARFSLYNMLEYAVENDMLPKNLCTKLVKSSIGAPLTNSRTLEFRHSAHIWREGPPKSQSGYRTIPLTKEAIEILKEQKKNSIPSWRNGVK